MKIKMEPIIKKKTTIKVDLEKITRLLDFIENFSTTTINTESIYQEIWM